MIVQIDVLLMVDLALGLLDSGTSRRNPEEPNGGYGHNPAGRQLGVGADDGATCYFVLLKSGVRFSLNEVMPSRALSMQAERPKAL
jgi:hypothetical protein